MKGDVNEYCRNCSVCYRFKSVRNLYPAPFEWVQIDLVAPMGASNYKYILNVIYVLTRFLITVALRTKEVDKVAEVFLINVMCAHVAPRTVVTDQGREFVNQILQRTPDESLDDHII